MSEGVSVHAKRSAGTWFNYPSDWKDLVRVAMEGLDHFKCFVGQEERCPSEHNGRAHIQFYMEVGEKIRFRTQSGLRDLQGGRGIHWETAKGNKRSNNRYCSKVETRIHGPEETLYLGDIRPIPPPCEVRTISLQDMEGPKYAWERDLLEVISEDPDDRTIHWLWSEGGKTGKTSFMKYLAVHHDALVVGGKAADVRNAMVTVKAKRDPEGENGSAIPLVVVNIPRSFSADFVSYESFENVKDGIFYSGKYEGATYLANPPHLIIFSNFHPVMDKMSEDRWVVRCID